MKHKATKHAKKRIVERTDLSLSGIDNFSNEVYKNGYKLHCFEGDLYEYLLSKRLDGCKYDLRVYDTNIYIFDTRLKQLVTVYPIPANLLPIDAYFISTNSPCIIIIKYPDGHKEYVYEDGSFGNDIALAIEFRTKQKAINYIKSNHNLTVLIKQGCEMIVLDLS